MQELGCNGIVTATLKQVITTLAGEYCVAVALVREVRAQVFDCQMQ
jgi:hypothetical protein